MKIFYFDVGKGRKYSLHLWELQTVDSRTTFNYIFRDPNKKVIFKGNDFSVYAGDKNDWKSNAMSLMGFLTLEPGDTDEEYFKNYTKDQFDFINSDDFEELKTMVYDYENERIN